MINKIEQTEINSKKISNLPTRPNSTGLYGDKPMSSKDLKERMDALSLLAISKLNEIVEGMAAGGEVAETMKFKHGDKEYSLAKFFSMIFESDGLSDVLITDDGKTVNTRLSNLSSSVTLLEEDIDNLEEGAKKTNEAVDDLEEDLNEIKKSKSKVVSSNEFDESKLPSKIYYKVLDPEWVNAKAVADKNQPFEATDIAYTKEEQRIKVGEYNEQGDYDIYATIAANSYYMINKSYDSDHEEEDPSYDNSTPLQQVSLDKEICMVDANDKIIYVHTEKVSAYGLGNGGVSGLYTCYITTFRYEDGSPVSTSLTLYPTNVVEYYDFENLQFTTEAEGNNLLGDVYTYRNEWGSRCYTIYPDYTPNIAEGQGAISLAISDPENMLYSIKLEALFNGGYTFSLGNKDFAYLGGVDVVADGDGASASGRKMFVIGNGASGFGVLNKIRARNATAFGYNNTVTGTNGAAFNEGNKILAYAATGFGDHNTVGGSYDIIGGLQNKSKGHANLGQGTKNVIDGNYILGLGNLNVVKGICNIMQGYRNEIDGKYNDMNGFDNKIKGNSNIVNGHNNTISSSYNKVFGTQNTIIETSTFNVINGQNNEINAPSSVDNLIVGIGNIVEPSPYAGTKNYGYNVLVGRYNISRSTYGIACGANLIVDGTSPQLVLGCYNEVDRNASIIIGNGSSDTNRKNSLVIRRDGSIIQKSPNGTKYAITVNDDGTLSTKKVTN